MGRAVFMGGTLRADAVDFGALEAGCVIRVVFPGVFPSVFAGLRLLPEQDVREFRVVERDVYVQPDAQPQREEDARRILRYDHRISIHDRFGCGQPAE